LRPPREFLTPLMKELDVPGAVVVIVDSGKAVVTEGFGVADREAQTPVDPHQTIFRIASVGKVFTALAALQLVAKGELDLRAEVDRHLDFTEYNERACGGILGLRRTRGAYFFATISGRRHRNDRRRHGAFH